MAKNRAFLSLIFVIAIICSWGCATVKTEEAFAKEQVGKIQRGETTKQEILEWFGPPIIIARKGTIVKVPTPGLREKGAEEIHSDTFFELFSERNVISDHIIIYYYEYARTESPWSYFYHAHLAEKRFFVNKLWVLVNEGSDIVEDFLFREEE